LLGTAGAFSCFLAGVVLILPHADAALVASLLGAYALAFGAVVTMAALAFRRRHTAVHAQDALRSSLLRSGASAVTPAGDPRSHSSASARRDQ
jgi:cell shape-determining protein MreD